MRPDAIAGVLSISLSALLWFWLIPVWVEPDADLRLPVSLVPQIVAIGFGLCGAALLIRSTVSGYDDTVQKTTGFASGELQGLVVMIAILVAATAAFQWLHFLLVAPVVVLLCMWLFGPLRPLSALLTATLGPLLIWVLATQLLGRALP
jgi:hypothetical protein